MARDEHGMPVPCDPKQDASAFFAYRDHAAKWHAKCREIVRRLAELDCYMDIQESDVRGIIADAAKLWSKMQEDAKGGDGETSV